MTVPISLACGLVVGACLGIVIACAVYARELKRMARFLAGRDRHLPARICIGVPLDGVSDLARSVNAELDRADRDRIELERDRAQFQKDLAALSHDIRTPLTGAKGYLQLAVDEGDPLVHTDRLRCAQERIDCTIGLLNQLFEYTKACDPGLDLTCERVELLPVVEEVLLAHYPAFSARGWEPRIDLDEGVCVSGDREALYRIVGNLVENALKYADEAPVVRMGAACEPGVLFSIANRAEHVRGTDPERLFDRFYRAEAARGLPGTGLGLTSARELARAMGLALDAHVRDDVIEFELAERPGVKHRVPCELV